LAPQVSPYLVVSRQLSETLVLANQFATGALSYLQSPNTTNLSFSLSRLSDSLAFLQAGLQPLPRLAPLLLRVNTARALAQKISPLVSSLPELIFGIRAALENKGDLAVGDAMGSVVCNSTLVLGVTAMISPITNSFFIFLTSAIFMAIVTFLFMIFIRSKKGLSITESVMLIMMYLLFILVEFYFKSKIF